MKTFYSSFRGVKNQKGTVLIFVTIAILALLAFVALTIDTGYVMVTRNELQNISDASALAATRQLGVIYESMTYEAQQSFVLSGANLTAVRDAAQDVANLNKAGQQNITLNDADIIIGQWNASTKELTETLDQPDAARVISRRDSSSPEGPITTFFARIFGYDTANVSADAIAALTAQSTAAPGGLPVPVGISRAWFEDGPAFHFCNQPIRFYPTNDPSSCAGWHVYNRYDNAPDSRLRATIGDLENGSYESPETIAYETQFEFTGGTMSTHTFAAMKSLFDSRKILNDGIIDNDTNSETWTTGVPVYNSSDCSNPHGSLLIVGFATIVITGVQDSPVHQIDGYVICENIEPGRGGGGQYGTKGSIPGLVE